jgi:hypothetical protein
MERDFTWSDGGRAFERMADLWPVSTCDEAPTAAETDRVKNGTADPPAGFDRILAPRSEVDSD